MTYIPPGTYTGELGAADVKVTGLTGATAGGRFVGTVAAGPPVSGTFVAGDVANDLAGKKWTCTAGGSPGTWTQEPGIGAVFSFLTKTANYTLTTADNGIAADPTSTTVTLTLPTAVLASKRYAIKALNLLHAVTINTTAGQTIDGLSVLSILLANQVYEVASDNTNWRIVASYTASPLTTEGDILYLHNGVPDRLTAGSGITIAGGTISASASGGIWGPISNGTTTPLILNANHEVIIAPRG